MIEVHPFAGYPVAVMGLGKSGLATARALVQSGAEVAAWDDSAERCDRARAAGVPIVDLARCDWSAHTTLVLSPGIPHTHPKPHPMVAQARAANCEIICDIELLARAQRNASFIGITGTNGKSTTTVLIGHIMALAGRKVAVGGNLGVPALELDALEGDGTYVLEMSSYQLELVPSLTFDVAVLTNISADHLDRHGGMDGYIAAKRRIFHRQVKPRSAVVGVDDPVARSIYGELKAADEQNVLAISGEGRVPGGIYVDAGRLIDDSAGQAITLIDLGAVATLPGRHNWQNAAAAYGAVKMAGVAPPVIAACINSYPGLAHRQEPVATIEGVRFVNDSKATNADAAQRALVCYDTIYWIAGGRAKEGGISTLAPYFPRIAHAYLIGEAAAEFARSLDGKIPYTMCGDLTNALAEAAAQARADRRPGAVVLLSPACASFDQYANFEARGDAFRSLVESLPGKRDDDALADATMVGAGRLQ
ncbi:MAG: UDP-N-acetylmuramoyl-L-alanine--D-glutamate ligase [Alphaproteobacteria bacterium]|nr:UDP-N-acetylmuramoyl-L-alanine--D-glutamate ligase [Alphaproteobacteria bacterium]